MADTAYTIIKLAGFPRKRQQHTPDRPAIDRENFPHAHMMPDGLRPIDAHNATAEIAFAYIECRAFACGLRQFAQYRLDACCMSEYGLIARAEPAGAGTQPP